MAFTNNLASLIVNIIVRTKDFDRGIAQSHTRIVGFTAKIWLLRAALLTITAALKGIIETAAKTELGFAKIERILPGLRGTSFRSDVLEMANELKAIDLTQLQGALKNTARLGIRAKEDLHELSKQIAVLSILGEMGGEQAATSFGKLVTVFNVLPKDSEQVVNGILGVAQALSATESEVLNISLKFAGAAKAAGLTLQETLALAGATRALGRTSTVSATSLSKLITQLSIVGGTNKVQKFAEAIGMTKEGVQEFSSLMDKDPIKGLQTFVKAFKNLDKFQQDNVLNSLGLSRARIRNTILALASTEGEKTLARALLESKKAMEENVLSMQQMQTMGGTLDAEIKGLSRSWTALKTNMGESDSFRIAIDRLGVIADLTNKAMFGTTGFKNALEGLDFSNKKAIDREIKLLKDQHKERQDWINQKPGMLQNVLASSPAAFGLSYLYSSEDFSTKENYKIYQKNVRAGLDALRHGSLEDLDRKIKTLSDIRKKLDTKKELPIRPEKDISDIPKEEMEKKKKRAYQGFMDITQARRNWITDQMEGNIEEKQLKVLEKIREVALADKVINEKILFTIETLDLEQPVK